MSDHRMTDAEVALFERGFAAYADGISNHDSSCLPLIIADRRWWLKGWYASRSLNVGLRGKSGGA